MEQISYHFRTFSTNKRVQACLSSYKIFALGGRMVLGMLSEFILLTEKLTGEVTFTNSQ
jgi:hypothetical protein